MQCKTFTDYFAVESENKRKAAIDAENKKCTTQNIKEVRENKIAYFTHKAKATTNQLDCNTQSLEKWWQETCKWRQCFHTLRWFSGRRNYLMLIESVAKTFGKYDENRAAQNGYQPIPFQAGRKMA
jgi:peptidylprolyl isomerase